VPTVQARQALRRCAWCQRGFRTASRTGRLPQYCKRSCRQRAYEARRRAAELRLGDDELVVARTERDALLDAVWVLECVVDDVRRDLADDDSLDAHRTALAWLTEAADALFAVRSR
jgi:hypothetical protein